MTIAVHISITGDPVKNFNYTCFTILAGKYPEHHFIFIFDRPFDQQPVKHTNITPVLLSPQIRNRLLAYYWYNFKIPSLLAKYNTDIFITDGINCSMRVDEKQCMIIHDLSFLQKENLFSRSELRYLKKYFKRFVSKADLIVTSNPVLVEKITTNHQQAAGKVYSVPFGMNEPLPVTYDQVQAFKDTYTEGKEYFLAFITDASAKNTITLLKAFSAFKKRQLSNMQLVLAIPASSNEHPIKDLATYKYRKEVKLLRTSDELTLDHATASAYAAIYLPTMEVMEDEGLTAVMNHVPLITINNDMAKGLYMDAALYASVDEKDLAEKMMLLYKDENYRNDLIRAGKALVTMHSWDNAAESLWQLLIGPAAQ